MPEDKLLRHGSVIGVKVILTYLDDRIQRQEVTLVDWSRDPGEDLKVDFHFERGCKPMIDGKNTKFIPDGTMSFNLEAKKTDRNEPQG